MSAIISVILSKWGISVLVALICGILGTRFQDKKYRAFSREIIEVGAVYWKATRPGSPGGKALTSKEKQQFAEEIIDVIQAGVPLLPAKWSVK